MLFQRIHTMFYNRRFSDWQLFIYVAQIILHNDDFYHMILMAVEITT